MTLPSDRVVTMVFKDGQRRSIYGHTIKWSDMPDVYRCNGCKHSAYPGAVMADGMGILSVCNGICNYARAPTASKGNYCDVLEGAIDAGRGPAKNKPRARRS